MAVSGWWLIRGLLWPVGRGALAQAAVLTFVLAMNNFAVPAILQVKVFPAEMWVRFNTTFDTLGALRLSWPLVVAPLLLLLWFARREFPWPRTEGAVPARLFRQQLGLGWFWLGGGCTILLCLLAVGLPVFQLASVKRTWTELPGALRRARARFGTPSTSPLPPRPQSSCSASSLARAEPRVDFIFGFRTSSAGSPGCPSSSRASCWASG